MNGLKIVLPLCTCIHMNILIWELELKCRRDQFKKNKKNFFLSKVSPLSFEEHTLDLTGMSITFKYSDIRPAVGFFFFFSKNGKICIIFK